MSNSNYILYKGYHGSVAFKQTYDFSEIPTGKDH